MLLSYRCLNYRFKILFRCDPALIYPLVPFFHKFFIGQWWWFTALTHLPAGFYYSGPRMLYQLGFAFMPITFVIHNLQRKFTR